MKVYRSHFSFLHINTFIVNKPLYLFSVAHVLFSVPRSLPPHILSLVYNIICKIIVIRIRRAILLT